MGQDPENSNPSRSAADNGTKAYSPPPKIRLDEHTEFENSQFGHTQPEHTGFDDFHGYGEFEEIDAVYDEQVDPVEPLPEPPVDTAAHRDNMPTFSREVGGTVTTFAPQPPPGTVPQHARSGEVRMPKQPDAELDQLLADLSGGPKRRSREPGQHSATPTAAPADSERRVTNPQIFPWALVIVMLLSAVLAAVAIIAALG